MNENGRADYVRDGRSREQLRAFLDGDAAVNRWEQVHPRGLDEYSPFLDELQAVFGPFPVGRTPWPGTDYRL